MRLSSAAVVLAGLALSVSPDVARSCGPFFYAAPPPLGVYPERHPIKAFAELFPETHPVEPDALTADELDRLAGELIDDFQRLERNELLRRISTALTENRAGDYRVRYANLFHEMAELARLAPDPASDDVRTYLAWRKSRLEFDDGFIRRPPAPSWTGKIDPEASAAWTGTTAAGLAEAAEGLEETSADLEPFWRVQLAAWLFRRGLFEAAAAHFANVRNAAPNHPRAEVALLMEARSQIEAGRDLEARGLRVGVALSSGNQQAANERRRAAQRLLEVYRETYPEGRYLPDSFGWDGAIASDSRNWYDATAAYLDQLESRPTREVARSALRELDRVFGDFVGYESRSHFPYERIAQHPAVAMLFTYRCLDPAARVDFTDYPFADSFDPGSALNHLRDRVVIPRPRIREQLRLLAAAVAARPMDRPSSEWDPFLLAVLGWAASEHGEHQSALKIATSFAERPSASDHMRLLEAVALQRLERWSEAAAAFRDLQENFPRSALCTDDVRFRLATCLARDGHAGLAAIALAEPVSRPADDSAKSPRSLADPPPLQHLQGEFAQWIDAWIQFAPVEQMEEALEAAAADPELDERIRTVVRARLIAAHRYDDAARWLSPASVPDPYDPDRQDPARLDRGRWIEIVEPIIESEAAVSLAQSPVEKAQAFMRLGRLWESIRGKLLAPSLAEDFMASEEELTDLRRRRNAEMVGLSQEAADQELERRDEAWHARRAYEAAADAAPGTMLAASALESVNRMIRAMAELSLYQRMRAFEREDETASREIFDTLKDRHADAPEAARAVFWTLPFAMTPELHSSYAPPPWLAEIDIVRALADIAEDSGRSSLSYPRKATGALWKELLSLGENADELSRAELLDGVRSLRGRLEDVFRSSYQAGLLNDLEDLELFLIHVDAVPDFRRRYFAVRLTLEGQELGESIPEAARPFTDFIQTAAAAEHAKDHTRRAALWDAYLDEHADGPKAEAAHLRLTRSIARQHRRHAGVSRIKIDASPTPRGISVPHVRREKPPDPQRVSAALNEHEAVFPNGRYAAEIALLRGANAIDGKDWGLALDCLGDILDDAEKADLHVDAALNLAVLFMKLLDEPDARNAIASEIAARPSAQRRLAQFMNRRTMGRRLGILSSFLAEEFGIQAD